MNESGFHFVGGSHHGIILQFAAKLQLWPTVNRFAFSKTTTKKHTKKHLLFMFVGSWLFFDSAVHSPHSNIRRQETFSLQSQLYLKLTMHTFLKVARTSRKPAVSLSATAFRMFSTPTPPSFDGEMSELYSIISQQHLHENGNDTYSLS
jgi:hypothetical protein